MPSPQAPLSRVAVSIFEELTFAFAGPAGAGATVEQAEAVSVRFDGPFRGRVIVRVPRALLPSITASMLGDDEAALDPAAQRDALGELGNVVCGHLLPELAGRHEVFDLQAPVAIADADAHAAEGESEAAAALVEVDGGCAEVKLLVSAGALPPSLLAEGVA